MDHLLDSECIVLKYTICINLRVLGVIFRELSS